MSFAYRNGVLCAEKLPLDAIARRFGTPCFVYSGAAIEAAYGAFAAALRGRDAMVCYSVKANSNLAVLALLAKLGAGFDIVSGGELARVLAAGGDPRRTVFSGVGKTDDEIALALRRSLLCINVESESELERVARVARRLGRRAPIALRVNPDIDARTHPYISTGLKRNKFGVPHGDAERLYRRAAAMPGIEIAGIGCHIGSQMLAPAPLAASARRVVALVERLARAGIALRHIDLGGGFGIRYRRERPQPAAAFVRACLAALKGRPESLILDPGRSIVGNAGVLLTRIEVLKRSGTRRFLVVDAAMNDLIRPSLYGAWHEIAPVRKKAGKGAVYDVVGPVCESADFLGHGRRLAVAEGDLLAVHSAGAYGMVMSSNYNTRPRAAEVLVRGSKAHLVRRRETVRELFALERIPG
jgi:diaminopimelate decarboxylase